MATRLWILSPVDDKIREQLENDPWEPWYDKTFGFIVRAHNEENARTLASKQAGDEKAEPWLNSKFSNCVLLEESGEEQVILSDFRSA